jgi:hypothetical protein
VFDAEGVLVDKHASHRNPFYTGDQDTLNALLMSEFADRPIHHIDTRETVLGPEALAVRIRDRDTLRCERGGHPVMFVHTGGTPKPWEPSAGRVFRPDAYMTLLRRLLHGEGLRLRLTPDAETPAWLRPGARGWLTYRLGGMRNVVTKRGFWTALARRYLSERAYDRVRRLAQAPQLRYRSRISTS